MDFPGRLSLVKPSVFCPDSPYEACFGLEKERALSLTTELKTFQNLKRHGDTPPPLRMFIRITPRDSRR
jgi:hypothetical protein